MSVDEALAFVAATPTSEETVERFRTTMVKFAEAHPDALHRTCLSGHFTASAMIVNAEGDKVLLMHHTKLKRWLQPGGHVDGDGDLASAALREASEETGLTDLTLVSPALDLDIHQIPERGSEPAHDHLDVRFLVQAGPGATIAANHESTDMQWFGFDALDGLGLDAGLHRLLRSGQARLAGNPSGKH